MKTITISLIIVAFAGQAFAGRAYARENDKAHKDFDRAIKLSISRLYSQNMNKLVKSYNNSKFDLKKKLLLLEYAGFNFPNTKTKKNKAYFKNGIFEIPNANIQINLHNYLNNTFSYNGEEISLNCADTVDCLRRFYLKTKPKTTGLFSPFRLLSQAYAKEVSPKACDWSDQIDLNMLEDKMSYYEKGKRSMSGKGKKRYEELQASRKKILNKCKKEFLAKKTKKFSAKLNENLLEVMATVLHLEKAAGEDFAIWSCRFCPMGLSKQEATAKNLKTLKNKLNILTQECRGNIANKSAGFADQSFGNNTSKLNKIVKFIKSDKTAYNAGANPKMDKIFEENLYVEAKPELLFDSMLSNKSCREIYQLGVSQEVKQKSSEAYLKENQLKRTKEKLAKLLPKGNDIFAKSYASLLSSRAVFGNKQGQEIQALQEEMTALEEEIYQIYSKHNLNGMLTEQNAFCKSSDAFRACLVELNESDIAVPMQEDRRAKPLNDNEGKGGAGKGSKAIGQ